MSAVPALLLARRARLVIALLVTGAAASADAPAARFDCRAPAAAESPVAGRMLVLPGVYNTRFQLRGFVANAKRRLPAFDIEVRSWGTPFLPLHNLRAHERNVATAERIAAEIAAWREEHPEEPFYLVGYSGGGGMATLVASALPEGVAIDRLVLIAPAISPRYPLEAEVLPRVREWAVNYASERDLQVGWGTRTFGTIDRVATDSAGATGFALEHPKLLQWRWSERDRACGHPGNHLSYLGRRWQGAALLPALDPDVTAGHLRALWAHDDEESDR